MSKTTITGSAANQIEAFMSAYAEPTSTPSEAGITTQTTHTPYNHDPAKLPVTMKMARCGG